MYVLVDLAVAQHVLIPGHTLEEANLLDGQLVLLEMSQQDGAWPRSQLQSMLEAEEEEAQAGTAVRYHTPHTHTYTITTPSKGPNTLESVYVFPTLMLTSLHCATG